MTETPAAASSPAKDRTPGRLILNAIRGGLIGTAETVPGVSGGTVALMTGVYETILTSAGHLIGGIRIAVTDGVRGRGLDRARPDLARVRWGVLLPLGVGMVAALLVMAHFMEGLVEDHPETMRGLFLGLVLASLAVPFRLAAHSPAAGRPRGRWGGLDVLVAAVAAAATATVLSLSGASLEPTPAVLVPAAAIAVSALVLPGLSGSFLLLTMGLYAPTLAAVNDRDLGYLAWFALGAAIGLVTIVKLLQWLLEHHRRLTLVILTGVMAGSLRALWPWQDESRALLAPHDPVIWPVVAFVIGVLVVVAVLVLERRFVPAEPTAPAQSEDATA
ncbi:DUF368 domain-containing protein [Demequina pelophila]|uniref:DUF368 domain-containing protein n=1 Tax=Demequina pelophila TaxID=1638984 RepID=UPI000784E895|nr:DUF368 domain-containing protein [Demequina pelophila]